MDGKPSLQRFLNTSVNKELSDEEVLKLANVFKLEKDKKRQELNLRFFSTRKYPLDISPIFKIAKGINPTKTRLLEFVVEALQHFSSKEIRDFAIDKITNLKDPSDYLKLLVSNYKKGDYKLLCEIVNKSNDYEYIHNIVLGFGSIKAFEFSPGANISITSEIIPSLILLLLILNCLKSRSKYFYILLLPRDCVARSLLANLLLLHFIVFLRISRVY